MNYYMNHRQKQRTILQNNLKAKHQKDLSTFRSVLGYRLSAASLSEISTSLWVLLLWGRTAQIMILWSINETSLNTATGLPYIIITTSQSWPPLVPQTDHYDHLAKRQQICYRPELLCVKEAISEFTWGIMLHCSQLPEYTSPCLEKYDFQLPGNSSENLDLIFRNISKKMLDVMCTCLHSAEMKGQYG